MILDAEQQTWIEVWWDAIHSKTWKEEMPAGSKVLCNTLRGWQKGQAARKLAEGCDNFSVHSAVSQISFTYGITVFAKISCGGDISKTLLPQLADLLKHLVIPAKHWREMTAEMTGCIFQHIKKTFVTIEDACTGLNSPSVAPMSPPVSPGQGHENRGPKSKTGSPHYASVHLCLGKSAHQITWQSWARCKLLFQI